MSEEVQINSDHLVGVEPELVMGMQYRGRPGGQNNLYKTRRGHNNDRIYYNCRKSGHLMQDCCQSNRRPDLKQQLDDNAKLFVQNKCLKNCINKVTNVSINDNNESEEEGKKLLLRMARQKQKLPAEDNC